MALVNSGSLYLTLTLGVEFQHLIAALSLLPEEVSRKCITGTWETLRTDDNSVADGEEIVSDSRQA